MAGDIEKLDLRVYGDDGKQRAFRNIGGVLRKVSDTVLRQIGLSGVEGVLVVDESEDEALQEIRNEESILLTENSRALVNRIISPLDSILRLADSEVQIVSRYLREQAEKSSVSSVVRLKKEDDTRDFSILRSGEIQVSPGPIGSSSSDAGVTRPTTNNFAKVIDLDSDSDEESSGNGAEPDYPSLKLKVLSSHEKAKIESEDENSEDEALMAKLARNRNTNPGPTSKLSNANQPPKDFNSISLILPKVPGLNQNSNQFPGFPVVRIDPKDNQTCSKWLHGWKDRCPIYTIRADGVMPELEQLRPVESLLYWPLGPMRANKRGEREVWMYRGQDWGMVHLVIFGVGTESTKFVSPGENFGTSKVVKKQIRYDITEIDRRIALFKNAGIQVGHVIDEAMVKRNNDRRIAFYREEEEAKISRIPKSSEMTIEAARIWNEIQKQLESVYPASGFQGCDDRGTPSKIKFWQLSDSYKVYKKYSKSITANELSNDFYPADFMLANLGIYETSIHKFPSIGSPFSDPKVIFPDREMFAGFFLAKWRSASQEERDHYNRNGFVDQFNAPFTHKPFHDNTSLRGVQLLNSDTKFGVVGGITLAPGQTKSVKHPSTD